MLPLQEIELSDNTREVFTCLDSGERIGFAIGSLREKTLDLEAINVYPPFRRQGFGSQMLRALENWAVENGASVLRGEFLPDAGMQKAVKSFYERNGVEVTRRFLFKELR